ncbi:MAG: phosphatidylglycerophosphatase A [bacterium]|nr:phosphatidylglycerophosphatase A [bacterium]
MSDRDIDLSMTRTRVSYFLVTLAYSGLSPKAPGTAGTAVAAILAVLAYFFIGEVPSLTFSLFFSVFGFLATSYLLETGGNLSSAEDPQEVVVDEAAGYFVALSFVGSASYDVQGAWPIVIAFLFFRLFDIWKPFPISRVEALPGAWGIMADDIIAGVFAGILLRLLPT